MNSPVNVQLQVPQDVVNDDNITPQCYSPATITKSSNSMSTTKTSTKDDNSMKASSTAVVSCMADPAKSATCPTTTTTTTTETNTPMDKTRKKSVRFAPTLKKKFVPHYSEYSSAQRKQIWYSENEIFQIQEDARFEMDLKQHQQNKNSPTGGRGSTYGTNRLLGMSLKKTLLGLATDGGDSSLLSPSSSKRAMKSSRARRTSNDVRRGGSGGSRRDSKKGRSLSPKRNASEPVASPLSRRLGYLGLIGGKNKSPTTSPTSSPTKRRLQRPNVLPPPITIDLLNDDKDDDDDDEDFMAASALPLPKFQRYQTR